MEGRFSKFVSGGDVETKFNGPLRIVPDTVKTSVQAIGPFSHYSTISPASTSGTLSRNHSQTDLNTAVPHSSTPRQYVQSDLATLPQRSRQRPSSQSDLVIPLGSLSPPSTYASGPPPVARAQYMTHHVRSSSLGFAGQYNYDPTATQSWQSYPQDDATEPEPETTPKAAAQEFSESSAYSSSTPYGQSDQYGSSDAYEHPREGQQGTSPDGGWWGSESSGPSSSSILRAPSFTPLEESFAEDESGFISPMAAYTSTPSPGLQQTSAYSYSQNLHKRTSTREELDDLGIGNSKSRRPGFDSIGEHADESDDGTVAERKEMEKPGTFSKRWRESNLALIYFCAFL